jgi:hypothetical protein
MTGSNIKLALEQMIKDCPEPVGSFPHISNEWFIEYDLKLPPLQRIVSISYKRKLIDMEEIFLVGIQDFYIERDGDLVDVFSQMEVAQFHGKLVSDCVIEYLRTIDCLSGEPPMRFIDRSALAGHYSRATSSNDIELHIAKKSS